jgi:hypothetical protein
MADHTIRPGDVYEPCDPLDDTRIRVVAYTPGATSADIVDAESGKRRRWVLVSSLYAAETTEDGHPRRSGYHLVNRSGDSEAPDVRPGQVWADDDKRHAGRTLRVERINSGLALCQILTNTDETQGWLDRKNPHVHDRRGKTIPIALDRFSTDFRLVQDS